MELVVGGEDGTRVVVDIVDMLGAAWEEGSGR